MVSLNDIFDTARIGQADRAQFLALIEESQLDALTLHLFDESMVEEWLQTWKLEAGLAFKFRMLVAAAKRKYNYFIIRSYLVYTKETL